MKVFNIGDRVRTIDSELRKHPLGSEFTVAYLEIDEDDDVFVGSAEDGHPAWFSYHFELASSPAKFNIGDRVIITVSESRFFAVGDTGTISHEDSDGDYWVRFDTEREGDYTWCVGRMGENNTTKFEHCGELAVAEPSEENADGHLVGDLVKVVNNDYGNYFTIGDVLPVKAVAVHGVILTSPTEGANLFFLNNEVEASPALEIAAERSYKVGDIVQILHSDWPVELPVGSMFTVDVVFDYIGGVSVYHLIDGERTECYFMASEVQLVVPVEDVQLLDATEDGGFQLTDDEPVLEATEIKPLLTIIYGGVTVELDPNVAFSRKFADVMLELAYN